MIKIRFIIRVYKEGVMSEVTNATKQEDHIGRFVCVLCLDSFPTAYEQKLALRKK